MAWLQDKGLRREQSNSSQWLLVFWTANVNIPWKCMIGYLCSFWLSLAGWGTTSLIKAMWSTYRKNCPTICHLKPNYNCNHWVSPMPKISFSHLPLKYFNVANSWILLKWNNSFATPVTFLLPDQCNNHYLWIHTFVITDQSHELPTPFTTTYTFALLELYFPFFKVPNPFTNPQIIKCINI